MRYRYRCEAGSTARALARIARFDFGRLGSLVAVRAYRFRSTRRTQGGTYNALHERVMVVGTAGTARFSGFCWSYCGEGPHGLVELLVKCGIDRHHAQNLAFRSERKEVAGTDWTVELQQAA